jgi:(p)ppGpp synthase/HD superfamily hydrolase
MTLTIRFAHALEYAFVAHAGQSRKATETPYIAHPLAVASLVLEHGADENTAIAALLHDVAEDAGGTDRLCDIAKRFGEEVANIVAECSDTLSTPKPPWKARKETFLSRIPRLTDHARLINQADLVHNARSILNDLTEQGDRVWIRFRGGKDGTLWYFRSALAAHRAVHSTPLLNELSEVLDRIETQAKMGAESAT